MCRGFFADEDLYLMKTFERRKSNMTLKPSIVKMVFLIFGLGVFFSSAGANAAPAEYDLFLAENQSPGKS